MGRQGLCEVRVRVGVPCRHRVRRRADRYDNPEHQEDAAITVPSYSIERVVPQIHALYQQTIFSAGLLTFDSTLTSRYLFDKENTVREATDGFLDQTGFRVEGYQYPDDDVESS